MKPAIVRGGAVIADARASDGGVVRDGGVLVRGDTIEAVGPFDSLAEQAPEAEVIGSEQDIVMPGLANTHHHGWGLSTFQLGVEDDLLDTWLIEFHRGMRYIDPYLDTLWSDLRLIRSGVTSVLHAGFNRDMTSYTYEMDEKLRAHSDSGMRTQYALNINDQNLFVYEDNDTFLDSLPPDLAVRLRDVLSNLDPVATPDGIFEILRDRHAKWESHPRVSIMICPIAPQWCSDPLLKRIREEANDLGILIHLHCLESFYQREYGHRVYGTGVVQHLEKLGFLDETVSLGHAVWLNDEEMRICAATGTSVCHNASSNLRLRVGIMPATRMLEHGVNVSLGIDGTGIDDDEDMIKEMRLVAKLHRIPRGIPLDPAPSSLDVLRMATANGGRTLGAEGSLGSLAPGFKADMVVVNTDAVNFPYLQPGTDPVDALLYRAKGNDVRTVMIDGEVVLRDGRFTTIDEDQIAARLAASAETAGTELHSRWAEALVELRPYVREFYANWSWTEPQPYYLPNSSV